MDTAQPEVAAETDPNVALENAASAFKAFLNPSPAQPRDVSGRFAAQAEPEEQPDTIEPEQVEADPEESEDEQEAADEAQPMPPSWPADQAEQWSSLPPETQAFLAEREGERERAVQAKFQESANVRKAAEAAQSEANAARGELIQRLEFVKSLVQPVKPDPRAFGAGTGQYNREGYDLALADYEQQSQALAQIEDQLKGLNSEQNTADQAAFQAWKAEHESVYRPKLLSDVTELTDPVKAEPFLRGLIGYAIENGFPEELFAVDRQGEITSAQIHTLWKAQQFDKLRASKPEAKPKPASPVAKPGVSSPRSAQKAARAQSARDRLAREGSIEAGAAVWKTYL